MSYKFFAKIIFVVFFIFVGLNYIIWEFATKDILTRKSTDIVTGDMSRMGYLPKLNHKRKNIIDLPKRHIDYNDFNDKNRSVDMITIGDSFSQGLAGGKNRFYQDYIATQTDMSVLNIPQIQGTRNYIETVLSLLNNGKLKEYGVKYILIESTQRKVVSRFSILFDKDVKIEIADTTKIEKNSLKLPEVSFINNGNFKYLSNSILYNFSPRAFVSNVYKEKLNHKLFSIKSGDDILFYRSDIRSVSKNTLENITKVNNNLNQLANILKKENIQLIFMPAVAKYDLYRDFMINKENYPEDRFFEYFRSLEKEYIFVDTKKILFEELQKGEKDIFYIDDTHWSYKASDTIAKEISRQIQ